MTISTLSHSTLIGLTTEGMANPQLVQVATKLDRCRSELAPIRTQLAEEGMESDYIETIETAFLQFAALSSISDRPICPSSYEDEYWHQLILNTRLYANWCTSTLGRFLHHRPGEQSAETIRHTKELKNSYFAIDQLLAATCNGNNCGNS